MTGVQNMRFSCLIRIALCIVALVAHDAAAASAGQLWPVDCLTKVLRTDPPGASGPIALSGARGEIVSGQVALQWEQDVADVEATVTDLRHRTSAAAIPRGAVRLQWVRSIEVGRNTALPQDELISTAPLAIPDPYWEDKRIAVKVGETQPLWIETEISRQAEPGDYVGTLTVRGGGQSLALPIELHVWDFEMPADRHVSVINWWRFPGLGFEQRVVPFSDEYWELLGKFCRFLVAHRQTDVNASLAGLIVQHADNASGDNSGPAYDTSRLERYAEVAFEAGIRCIHLHSLGHATAGLTDPASRVAPVEENFRRLPALEQMIGRRGWKGRFLVSLSDEPFVYHEESFAALIDRIHQTAPSVRCIEAVEAEYLGRLDVYVPKLSHLNLWYPRFDQVRREGAELWFYTCCHPLGRYPNRFLDQPLIKTRILHWINYLYDLDGYLHWGLNHFHGEDPYTEAGVSEGLPLGDRAVVYPGKEGLIGSLRFSAMRDGLQDFEYLWVLQDRLAQLKQRVGADAFWFDPRQRPLELCRRVIWSFHDYTRDPRRLLETRRAIAEEIESLEGEPLLVVQTSPPEGTNIPAGPRQVIVRGLTTPGAAVTLNDQPVENVRESGYFFAAHFLPDEDPVIRVTVEHQGQKRTVVRSFTVSD